MLLLGPTPVPRLADQASARGWPFGFYHFPDATPENEYFNPALVEWQGSDYLIVRRRQGRIATEGVNTIEAWQLKQEQPSKRHPLRIENGVKGARDPRAFIRGETLILSFCEYLEGGFAHQAMTGVRKGFSVEQPIHLAIGQNGDSCETARGHEKNWCPFLHEGFIHISYALCEGGHRHVVIQTSGAKPKRIFYGHSLSWPWGTPRGGSCPILVDGLFWAFFHSHTPWYVGKRRYHMGALAFAAEPPFHVVRMARNPLLSASEMDFRNQHAPPCIWPGGAIFRDGKWLIALGVNDCACARVEIPHENVERSCYVTC